MTEHLLICPFCGTALRREGNSFLCQRERPHCFDIAKSGYATLTRAAGKAGDDRGMVRARTAFLEKGYYAPFADAVVEALCGSPETAEGLSPSAGRGTVLDAGCGEGYYSNRIAREGFAVLGFDLSKSACDHAAKTAKAAGNDAFFGAASLFELPVADGSVDAVVSLFAPVAEKEFSRVLKPGGMLIVGAAGKKHLFELKQAIYENVYENEGRRDLPEGFEQIETKQVTYRFDCAGGDLRNLFSMTPYAFKTSVSDAAKLDSLSHLVITADLDLLIYRKKA